MKEFYTTVAGAADAEFVEKRSRFIAHVRPVEHEADALAFLNQCNRNTGTLPIMFTLTAWRKTS